MKIIKTEAERKLLNNLTWVWYQYLNIQDNVALGAGEYSFKLMEEYGLVVVTQHRFAEWTPLGLEFLYNENAIPIT